MLAPGATIGILGGGQLGRMLALAAAELGFKCHIYCPDPASPAFDVAVAKTVAAYEDEAALAAFAGAVSVVTYEFENVPVSTAAFLAGKVPVLPGPRALGVAQDRGAEKKLMVELGIPVARFALVDGPADAVRGVAEIGAPAVLKTRRFGYDGKGQVRIEVQEDAGEAWDEIGGQPAVLEAFVPFEREISVLVVRGAGGASAVYDVVENRHEDHILATSTVPAAIAPELAQKARAIGLKIAEALDYVGLLAVEMFVVAGAGGTDLLVNEIAPRVHNSGHWTQDAALVSQFENHIRAVAGWPLGSVDRHSDVVMTNLIGYAADNWATIAAVPGVRLHLYGKAEVRPGRKMGHVNRLEPRSG